MSDWEKLVQDLLVDIWFHLSDTDDKTLRGIADRARALLPDEGIGSAVGTPPMPERGQ